ncbi:uncharacterized protein LOC133297248 [Gastrolobium bilobum]|uniref:uncharacterized protein LOC133297248 n=1 Tax=Gastrolobium bilobum TaxID=150636 RepID=UPI002AB2478C|nr:uncharacterized protein LOC133297248 [Gastrolobium bilobum]
MWAQEGQVFITDVENGYVLVRFSNQKDLDHELTAGPWVILDHYLAIRYWKPDFNPFQAAIARITAWVRLPGFPIEYANTKLIKGIVNWLGKFIKVDAATTSLSRGRFARICVELDLTKPLSAEYKLEGRIKQVEYEGLHLVCYSCGQYDHRSEMCPNKSHTVNAEPSQDQISKDQEEGVDTTMIPSFSSEDIDKDNSNGPWMLVNRQQRSNRTSDSGYKGKRENQAGQHLRRHSSKFQALADDSNEAEDGKEEKLGVENNEEEHVADNNPKNKQERKKETKNAAHVIETSTKFKLVGGGNEEITAEKTFVDKITTDERKERQASKKQTPAYLGQVENGMRQKSIQLGNAESKTSEIPSIQIIYPTNLNQNNNSQNMGIQHAPRPPDQNGNEMDHDITSSEVQNREDLGGKTSPMELEIQFGRVLKNTVRSIQICMIVLLETIVNSSTGSKIMNTCGFNSCFVEEAQGFSGGIWIMWDSNKINVEPLSHSDQMIHSRITLKSGDGFLCTAIYASPREVRRSVLWDELKRLGSNMNEPWLVGGDFNEIVAATEKKGGSPPNYAKCQAFKDILDECQLEDLGFTGSKFSWQGPKKDTKCKKPFRFQVAWHLHHAFPSFLNDNWDQEFDIPYMLQRLIPALRKWNNRVFGDIHRRKERLLKNLENIQHQRTGNDNDRLKNMEEQCQERLNKVMENSNRVVRLKDDCNKWITDPDELKMHACKFFKNLYSEDVHHRRWLSSHNLWPSLSEEDKIMLSINSSEVEIKRALFHMDSYKALGVDGFPAAFFQVNWDKLKTQLVQHIHSIWENPDLVATINSTLIVLIPKENNPSQMSQFRPIYLCPVIYKVLSKIVVQRMFGLMDKIISPVQASFVPGRHIQDNIIIVQELIHSMHRMKGRKTFMAIKVDLEKAYDRLNWDFIQKTL